MYYYNTCLFHKFNTKFHEVDYINYKFTKRSISLNKINMYTYYKKQII